MLLNRTAEPAIIIPEKIFIPQVETYTLKNNMPCFYIHAPEQDVLKFEIILGAGNYNEPSRLVAAATNELSDEGTAGKNARQIAEHFDFYGASIQTECGADIASLTLFTLGKFLKQTLPLLFEIYTGPVFPEDELETYTTQHKQRLSVSNKKVEFVARKKFVEKIFGSDHPYGYYPTEVDFDKIKTDDLKAFHRKAYLGKSPVLLISGNVTGDVLKLADELFGTLQSQLLNKNENGRATIEKEITSPVYSERSDAIQSAIRIGRKLINKTHPDFTGMSILNTVLGGYFGSRLMSNIREDKGYTYGIGSALVSMQHAGYFFIATEVGVKVTHETLGEIYSEINRLQQDLIPEAELRTVKNYLSGAFMRSIDGPFAQADKWKGIYLYGLDYGYYEKYLETLRNISAEELRGLAVKYLSKKDLTEVVVGKK